MNEKESKIVEISEVKHNFNLNVFEGPLDVLLYLARTSQIEIADISLNALIDQYITYIESVQGQGINVASEYIEMAAELIRLKSKTLLPNSDLEELEELLDGTYTRDQLIAKLIEYKKYKDVALELDLLHQNRPQAFYKSQSQMKEFRNSNFKSSIDLDKLKLAMQTVLINQEANVTETRMIEANELDVQSKIEHLKSITKAITFKQLIKDLDRLDRVAYFLGLLESIKLGFVHVGLDTEDILIKPGAVLNE
ncbi:segregation/condensation protein A [Mollicutes bacterium LVI A0039]|nr:segregation/condensation protein A [Mollicutes bacterium LVI A0039]